MCEIVKSNFEEKFSIIDDAIGRSQFIGEMAMSIFLNSIAIIGQSFSFRRVIGQELFTRALLSRIDSVDSVS